MLAILAVGGLRLALPDALAVGPTWLLLVILLILLVPSLWALWKGSHVFNQVMGFLLSGVITLDMLWSLGLLLKALPAHSESPLALLRSAAALWVSNILVFASWYWRLDAGGPHARETRARHTDGAFLFPQMTLNPEALRTMQLQDWRPGFIDYLFLAVNPSTEFSPTDVPVVDRWAKGLMMTQALISFATVAFLAARAVNIL